MVLNRSLDFWAYSFFALTSLCFFAADSSAQVVQTVCQTSGRSQGEAKAAFRRECGDYDKTLGHDCDPVGGRWICSERAVEILNTQPSPPILVAPLQPSAPVSQPEPARVSPVTTGVSLFGQIFASRQNISPASSSLAGPSPAPVNQSAPPAPVIKTPVAPAPVAPTPVVSSSGNCSSTINPGGGLQAAINGASNGQTLCLNPGTYSTSGMLRIAKNITLRGTNSSNPPTIRMSDARRGVAIPGVNNLTLDSLIFDGGNTAAREITILVSGSNNVTFQNVTIQNSGGIGLGIHSSRNTTILGGTIQNIGQDPALRQAIWAANESSNVVIDGLTVNGRANDRAGGDHAITCIGIDGFTVRNSRSFNAGSGVVAVNDCDNIVVENNTLVGGKEHGVDIVNGSNNAIVRNNDIRGMSRSAMVFDDHSWNQAGGGNPSAMTVSNNRMSGNNTAGSARCKGIGVDRNMVINPSATERNNSRWIVIESNNTVDSGPVYCDHVH